METVELVDELIERFVGWSTDGPHGVLRYLDQAYNILMTQESHQTLVCDENTGEMPTLVTAPGQRVYTLPNDIWRVGGVMTRNSTGGFKGKEVRISGEFFWQIDGVRTRDRVNHGRGATVIFAFDPGEQIFTLRAWRWPVSLTSTRIHHHVPSPNDILYLLPAAAALIDGVQNGTALEAREHILKVIKPRFWAAMNKGEQSEYTEPVDRGF